MESMCNFRPTYLKGIRFGSDNRKLCVGLWGMLWKEKPEIVIVPEFQISAIQVLLFRCIAGRKFKVVSMTDDSYDMIANNQDFTKLHAWLRKHLAKYFDDFIVVTPEVKHWYQSNFHKGIWMPIIMDEVQAAAKYARLLHKSNEYVEQYGLKSKKIVLYVGRLVEIKNVSLLISAFNLIKEDSVLVIVGNGPERHSLEQQAATSQKRIVFTGRFDGDALYAWYNVASVFVLPSYKEPFGAVTDEALLAGCRVVISQNAGSSCLVDNTNGELVNPFDVQEITDAIDRQLRLSQIPDLTFKRNSLRQVAFGDFPLASFYHRKNKQKYNKKFQEPGYTNLIIK